MNVQTTKRICLFPAGAHESASDKATVALKRIGAASEAPGAPQRKQLKVARKASILTRRSSFTNSYSSQYNRPIAPATNCVSDSMDQSTLALSTSFDSAFRDSTSIDSSGSFEGSSTIISGLPRPKIFRHKKPRKEKQQCRLDSGEKEKSQPQESSVSDTGYHEIIASIEKDFISPLKGFLQTPVKEGDSVLTSTPFHNSGKSLGVWISPPKGFTTGTEEHAMFMSGFFSPSGKGPAHQTTQNSGSPSTGPLSVGSLRELGLPGFTPLKNRRPSVEAEHSQANDDSPNTSLNLSNQSFTRLIGDFHLDSMMEDGLAAVDITGLLFESDTSS